MTARRLLQLVLLVQLLAALGIALAAVRWLGSGPALAAAFKMGKREAAARLQAIKAAAA